MNQHMPPEPVPFIDIGAQRRRLGKAIDIATKRVLDHCQFISGPEVAQLEQMLFITARGNGTHQQLLRQI